MAELIKTRPCKYGHDGLRYKSTHSCVECSKIRKQRQYNENREKAIATATKWNKENRERRNARARLFRNNYPSLVHKKDKLIYEGNRTARLMAAKKWASKNKELRRFYKHQRRVKEKDRPHEIRQGYITRLLREQNGRCYWCCISCHELYSVDHLVHLSKGGKNILANIRIACLPCNLRKNAKMPLDFAYSLFTS